MSLMHNYLTYLMQSRQHAWLMTAGIAFCSSLFAMPFFWFAGGIISLVTLHQGMRDGLLILIIALVSFMLGKLILVQFYSPASAIIVISFFVVWVLAIVLRITNSQWFQLMTALLMSLVLIGIIYISVDDITTWKDEFFWKLLAVDPKDPEYLALMQSDFAKTPKSPFFIGSVVNAMMLSLWLATSFIGRWWQSILYNPGGFRLSFHQLRIGRGLAIPTLVVLLVAMSSTGSSHFIAANMAIPIMVIYWLGGMALCHHIAAQYQLNWVYIFLLYLINIIPPIISLIIAAGFIDSWINFRKYIIKRNNNSQ